MRDYAIFPMGKPISDITDLSFKNAKAFGITWKKKNQSATMKIPIQKHFFQGGVNMNEIMIFLSIISDISSA